MHHKMTKEEFEKKSNRFVLTLQKIFQLERVFIRSENKEQKIDLMRDYLKCLDTMIELKSDGPAKFQKGTIAGHLIGLIEDMIKYMLDMGKAYDEEQARK